MWWKKYLQKGHWKFRILINNLMFTILKNCVTAISSVIAGQKLFSRRFYSF